MLRHEVEEAGEDGVESCRALREDAELRGKVDGLAERPPVALARHLHPTGLIENDLRV